MIKNSKSRKQFRRLYSFYRLAQGFDEQSELADIEIRRLPDATIERLGAVYVNSPSYLEGQPSGDPMEHRDIAKRIDMMRRGQEARSKLEPTTYEQMFVLTRGLTRFGNARPSLP